MHRKLDAVGVGPLMRRTLISLVAVVATLLPAGSLDAAKADQSCAFSTEGMAPGAPVGTSSCTGIARPGGVVRAPEGTCSFSFVFKGSNGKRYIATAGHCVLVEYTTKVWPSGTGPEVFLKDRAAGRFVWAEWGWPDFALIELYPDTPWSPEMLYWGGPTGMYTDHANQSVTVRHYGHGWPVGNLQNRWLYDVGPQDVQPLAARSGIAPDTLDREILPFYGAVVPGDSGSGAITSDGRAIGTVVRIDPSTGRNEATRLDASIAAASKALGMEFTLLTAPLRTTA